MTGCLRLIAQGFDLVFVDYANGAGDIRDNAKAYLKIVETLCEKAGSNKVVVGGFSMGGLISRLAMLYGQKTVDGNPCAKIQNVSKYIAADSPMQGAAGIPVSLQSFIKKYAPLQYPALDNPAAKQMLYEHIESAPNTSEHDKFYAFLTAMGNYPLKLRKYSIANSDWSVPYDGQAFHYTFRAYVSSAGSELITHTACASAGLADLILPGFSVWLATAACNPLSSEVLANTPIVKETISFSGHCLTAGSSIDLLKDIVVSDDVTEKTGFNFFLDAYDNESSLKFNDTLRRPTFMPIYSVFDLKSGTPKELQNAQNLDRLCRERWSSFDKIYLCPDGRQEHITFTPEYLKQLVVALKDRAVDISPILNLLLLD